MRYFNTSGPCYPEEHYTVLRKDLLILGKEKVKRGRFFTLFAPRQAGKTTFFQQLITELQKTKEYTPIWISLEYMKSLSVSRFYEALEFELKQALKPYQISFSTKIEDTFSLNEVLRELCQSDKINKLVLIIDEFEGIPDAVLSEVMHLFRRLYHSKDNHCLHSLILVGVSTVAELVVSNASPFNVVDELKIPYFTFDEVNDLISQYVSESGQAFETDVIRVIYENTNGQPGLVCALCEHLVEKVATDKSKPVTMSHFYETLRHFLTERFDKNILNIVQKAREKKDFMLKLLFGTEPIPYTVDNPNIAYLYAHGVITNNDGFVDIPVPIYSKRLITAFRPTINGETEHYITSAHEKLSKFLDGDKLNMHALLDKYCDYVRRRGFRAFDTEHLREAAWHYSLDGFMYFFVQSLGGETLIEVPTGRGRTDILILYHGQKYIIETKIYLNELRFEQGKRQLAQYLKSEKLEEGFYVVFSKKHSETDTLYFEEEIEGKKIYTYIIRVNFEKPSKVY